MSTEKSVLGSATERSTERTESHAPTALRRGWFWPSNSRKAHYFVGQRSLCGGMALFHSANRVLEDEGHESPDNCAKCKRERLKRYEPQTVGASPKRKEQ